MPIHDWTRVRAGTFHDFHAGWIPLIRTALNNGLLPKEYYAQAEQVSGSVTPDVLTLERSNPIGDVEMDDGFPAGGIALAVRVPKVKLMDQTEEEAYTRKTRNVVIRHSSDDRIVALLEIVSPGNKTSKNALVTLVDKAVNAILKGYHFTFVDLFPPTRRDPQGLHKAIWSHFDESKFKANAKKPLILAAYVSGLVKQAYVEQTAVGNVLIDMPLFLEPGLYVDLPLEATYRDAFHGLPRHYRKILDAK